MVLHSTGNRGELYARCDNCKSKTYRWSQEDLKKGHKALIADAGWFSVLDLDHQVALDLCEQCQKKMSVQDLKRLAPCVLRSRRINSKRSQLKTN